MRVSTTLIGVQSIDDGVRGEDPERSAMMTRQQLWTLAMALSVLLLTGPAAAGQASMLDSSEATAFMGTWVITMETPRGTNEQNVTISDQGGKVTARVERGRGGPIDITDIAKDGDSLVLSFERSFQGNSIDIVMTLSLDGDMINATMEFAGGQLSISGTGKKQ